MINIKSPTGLAKRAINSIVIAITNCYRTTGGQDFYLSTEISALRQDTQIPCRQPMLQR